MKIEKIRKINKSKIIIGGLIGLGIIGAVTILPSFAKYRTTQSFDLLNGKITYKASDFNLIAMYTIEGGIETSIDTVPPEDDGSYIYALNTSRSECTYNGGKVGNIAYVGGYLTFSQINKKGTKCNVYFDKTKKPDGKPASEVFATIKNGAKSSSTTFTSVADTNEGVFKISDPTYGNTTYYWRGAVTNNYVVFAGKCWRIIRINGNGSIRMIYDSSTTTCKENGKGENATTSAYNAKYDDNAYVGYMKGLNNTGASGSYAAAHTNTYNSDIKTYLDNWYDTNIASYASYIDDEAGFCNDRTIGSSGTGYGNSGITYYAARERIQVNATNAKPTFGCTRSDDLFTPSTSTIGNKILGIESGTIKSRPIGLITADEVVYAGGLYYVSSGTNNQNKSYYLYNAKGYWTMSPYRFDGSAFMFKVGNDGTLGADSVYYTSSYGVRPVINLKSTTTFTGNGGQTTPYVVQ